MSAAEAYQFEDSAPIVGPVCARHHHNLRVLSCQIIDTLSAMDQALCARDGEAWTMAVRYLGALMIQIPAITDRVADTVDMAGEA